MAMTGGWFIMVYCCFTHINHDSAKTTQPWSDRKPGSSNPPKVTQESIANQPLVLGGVFLMFFYIIYVMDTNVI